MVVAVCPVRCGNSARIHLNANGTIEPAKNVLWMALMWWNSSESCTTLSSMSIKNRVDIEIIKGNQSSRFCRRKTDLIFQDTQKDTHHKSSVEHLGHQELPTHQQQHHNCATSSMLGDGMSQSSTPEQVLLKIPASLRLSPCQQVSSMHLASAYANRAYKSGTTSWTKRIMGVLKIRHDMYQIYSHNESIGLCQREKLTMADMYKLPLCSHSPNTRLIELHQSLGLFP